jgi:hypothetical protein
MTLVPSYHSTFSATWDSFHIAYDEDYWKITVAPDWTQFPWHSECSYANNINYNFPFNCCPGAFQQYEFFNAIIFGYILFVFTILL